MALRKSQPIRFTPRGLSDAFDATDAFPGACRQLRNLMFDKGNPELVVSRPGVGDPLTTFASFTTPGVVSIQTTVGDFVYGLVASGSTPGHDEPFAFNHKLGVPVAVSGVTANNVPTTPSSTGDWVPPTVAAVGVKLLFTHPGFDGNVPNARFFGVMDLTNPAAPVWSSANLATNPLPAPPSAVANLNNRAWYAVGNKGYYSDVLVPLTATNAGQSITVGNTSALTALSGLPVSTTSSGVVQALLAFKETQIWQITGDPILGTLGQNYLSLTVGCPAPRTIVPTPIGTIFIANDGPHFVDPMGVVRPLTHSANELSPDLQVPFQAAQNRTRMAAGFASDVYRVCVDTILEGLNQTNEYWFDMSRRRWTGPHTWPVDCYSVHEDHFIVSHRSAPGALYQSRVLESPSATFLDAGAQISIVMESSTFPKKDEMSMKQVVESTIELSSGGAVVQYLIEALDSQHQVLNSLVIKSPPVPGLVWGGGDLWGGGVVYSTDANIVRTISVPWTIPLVFQKMALRVSAQGLSNLQIGTFYARWQFSGYTNQG